MSKRVRYHFGMLLSASDFTDEQTYFIEKTKRHNRLFHGSGIVTGLGVILKGGQVEVGAGAAVDCEGHEIVVDSVVEFTLPVDPATPQYLSLYYVEHEVDPIPVMAEPGQQEDEQTVFSRIEEGFKLKYERLDALSGHPPQGSLKVACNKKHGVTLAKFTYIKEHWRVE